MLNNNLSSHILDPAGSKFKYNIIQYNIIPYPPTPSGVLRRVRCSPTPPVVLPMGPRNYHRATTGLRPEFPPPLGGSGLYGGLIGPYGEPMGPYGDYILHYFIIFYTILHNHTDKSIKCTFWPGFLPLQGTPTGKNNVFFITCYTILQTNQ